MFLDYRIVNPKTPSYLFLNCQTTIVRHAKEKHKKYNRAADVRGTLVCTTDCVLHGEFPKVLAKIANTLCIKWQKSYSVTQNFVMIETEFAIVKVVSMKFRGTRKAILSLPLEDWFFVKL